MGSDANGSAVQEVLSPVDSRVLAQKFLEILAQLNISDGWGRVVLGLSDSETRRDFFSAAESLKHLASSGACGPLLGMKHGKFSKNAFDILQGQAWRIDDFYETVVPVATAAAGGLILHGCNGGAHDEKIAALLKPFVEIPEILDLWQPFIELLSPSARPQI